MKLLLLLLLVLHYLSTKLLNYGNPERMPLHRLIPSL